MLELLLEYGLFLAKSLTVLFVIIVIVVLMGSIASSRRASQTDGHIRVKKLQNDMQSMTDSLMEEILDQAQVKQRYKERQKDTKAKHKKAKQEAKLAKKAGKTAANKSSTDETDEDEKQAAIAQATTTVELPDTTDDEYKTSTKDNEDQPNSHDDGDHDKATIEDTPAADTEAEASEQQTSDQQENNQQDSPSNHFVLDFDGDIKASEVDNLRQEITAILSVAKPTDEIIVRLESPGGMVHAYGLAASQLARIKDAGIQLTICVDKVAASGGYMMACLANHIVAAPFAIVGSIGVVAEVPNIHRLLKKNDIDVDIMTAGEHKRTMTFMGQNTRKGREKFIEDLNITHDLFKQWVAEQRPQVNIEEVANGDVWYGQQALSKQLVDALGTSDAYLQKLLADGSNVLLVSYETKQTLGEKLGVGAASIIESISDRVLHLTRREPF